MSDIIDFSKLGKIPQHCPQLVMHVPTPQGMQKMAINLCAYRFIGSQLEFIGYGKGDDPTDYPSMANGNFFIENSRGSCWNVEELDNRIAAARKLDA